MLLARAQAQLELGEPGKARETSAQLLASDPWEWRALWIDGLAATQQGDWDDAKASFNAVYQQVPGELAPKLALAVACENGGQPDVAEGLYRTCAVTDAAYAAPAAFGMARVRAGRQDTTGAVAALDLVPATSRGYPESRQLRADVLLAGSQVDLAVLDQALTSIESVRMDPAERARYTIRILTHALDVVRTSARSRWPAALASGWQPGSAATRPRRRASATRSRSPTGRWRATQPSSGPGWSWSTRPTPYATGRSCDGHGARVRAGRRRQVSPLWRVRGRRSQLLRGVRQAAGRRRRRRRAERARGRGAGGGPDDDLGSGPISASVQLPRTVELPPPEPRACLSCGVWSARTATASRAGKALSERDHFREQPASWVAGVCDKGIRHTRNEDAMALLASEQPGGRAVLVVLRRGVERR